MSVAAALRVKDLQDIKSMMETAQGRRVIWRVLESGRVFCSTFSTEPLQMAFMEGQRNAGLALLSDVMEIAPKKFQVMMLEAKERRDLMSEMMEKEREADNE